MGYSKRGSGPPRRPRNPIAKHVRTPLYKPRVEEDKRWKDRLKQEKAGLPGESRETSDTPEVDEDGH